MLKTVTLVLITVMAALTMSAVASQNPMLVRVDLIDKTDIQQLAKLHLDIPYVTAEFADVVAYPEDLTAIEGAGLHYEVVHEDLVRFYQSRNPLGTTMGGFLTFDEIIDSMDVIHREHPDLVSAKDSIGASWEGRALWVYKISDNVDVDEDEPEVFYNSLIHAREPEAWAWQLYYINWLLDNYGTDPTATEIINERELYFLPVFNPDGYVYNQQTYPNGGGMWRKNRRPGGGVDLNRNWGYMWGYDDNGSSPYPDDETYRGPSAFSEPETQAVRDFIESRNFQFILNAHTYSNLFLYPFGYRNIYTPDEDIFEVLGDSATALTGYTHGTPWETLYNTNGDACDWQYGEQEEKPLIFTAVTETGGYQDGFWPPSYRIPQLNEQMLPLAIYISQVAGHIRAIAPPVPPVLNPIDTVFTDTFTVSWTHHDESNPAVAFELVEKSGRQIGTDDLESGADSWQLNGFSLSTARYHSANHSLFSGDESNLNSEAILNNEFTVSQGDTLSFYIWYDIEEGWDYGYVEISTDGGQTFASIPGNITTDTDPHGNNNGNGIAGSSNGWIEAEFPLNTFAGSTITARITYRTDGSVNHGGMYIDDVYPVETFAENLVISSDITGNSYLIEGRTEGTYYYQVRAKDAQDQWSGFSNQETAVVTHQTSADNREATPTDFVLSQNYPNPFNLETAISFSLASPGTVKVEVFDITGRLVNTLLDSYLQTGNHTVTWNSKNSGGETVGSGVYFYRLSTADNLAIRQMTLVK